MIITEVASHSQASRLSANGYFPLPCQGKAPIGIGWNLRSNPNEVDFPDDCTIGIRCGDNGVLGIDIDIEDDELGMALEFALGFRGLKRLGRPLRRLLLVRVANGTPLSHDLTFEKDGRREAIQLLGKGKQFIGFGVHPDTGRLYEWPGRSPLDTPVGELLTVDQEALEQRLVEVAARYGWRQRIVARLSGLQQFDSIPRDARERQKLGKWGVGQVEDALAVLRTMLPGTGRGGFSRDLGLRVGTLVCSGMLDGEQIAHSIYEATGGDYNSAYHSFPRGCAMSVGKAAADMLDSVRRGPALLAKAVEMGLPIGFPPSEAAGEVKSLPALPTAAAILPPGIAKVLLSAALKDRAAELGAKRKSKTVTDARANFSRLCVALAERDFVSSNEAFELGLQAKDLDIGSISDGKNPRLPTPDTQRLAELVLSTAASGGNIVLAIKGGAEVLNPPTLDGGIPDITGGCYPADDSFFDVLSSRLVGVNRGGTIFFAHKTLEGDVERIPIDVLRDLFSNIFVVEEESKTLAVDWYRRHPRFALKRAIFDPNKPEVTAKEFNYWRGFGVERRLGRALIRRFVRHVREIVCKCDRGKFKYLIRWLAWAVQNPAKNPETVVVLKSAEEGSGKSTVSDVMRKLFGKHAMSIKDPEELLGKHSGEKLEFASFVALEEALFAGDPRQASAMRSRITDLTMRVEPKFISAYDAPNRMHAILTTNHEWAVHAGDRARRWFVCEVSEERIGDSAWFSKLFSDLEAGGYGQLLNALLNVDLGDWHPRKLVRTEELAEQQRMSADSVTQWLRAGVEDGDLGRRGLGVDKIVFGRPWHTATLYDAYHAFASKTRVRVFSREVFGKRMGKLLGDGARRHNVREAESSERKPGYELPPIDEVKAALDKGRC